jgi:RNA polymerase sigma-70 factor (ECF subfamily)
MIDYTGFATFDLYRRFKSGDERAFEVLYNRLSGGLFNYCVRLLGDWHSAEDVLLETFAKLAKSNLNNQGNLRAWLYRVATNACYSLFRKRKTELKYLENAYKAYADDRTPGFVREMAVQRLLSGLPEHQRMVVILRFYEKMSLQEIAEVLCCPLGTVKSRMHQALKKLRSLVKKDMAALNELAWK